MVTKDALKALLDRVKAGVFIANDSLGCAWNENLACKAFNGSVDAALALKDAVLPVWQVYRFKETKNTGYWFVCLEHLPYLSPKVAAHDKDPARALLIAILEARIAEGEG